MPKTWYDRKSIYKSSEDGLDIDVDFELSIVADRKPYFMRYIYPKVMKDYQRYVKNTNTNSLREFRMSIQELLAIPESDRTERQNEFIFHYNRKMPLSNNNCVMNRICRKIEDHFERYASKHKPSEDFDYEILKSGEKYSQRQFASVNEVYKNYIARMRLIISAQSSHKISAQDVNLYKLQLESRLQYELLQISSNQKQLCDIMLDVCYKNNCSKIFCWNLFGKVIVENMLANNGNKLFFPTKDSNGEIEFGGYRFSMKEKECDTVG